MIESADSRPLVSVVIPTYRRAAKLDRLLGSLAEMPYPNLEILVVDNAASEDTAAVAARHRGVRYVALERNVFSAGARAAGERLCHGEYVLFIDDDNVASRELVPALVAAMEHDRSIGVAGPLMYLFDGHGKVYCAGGFVTHFGMVRYAVEVPKGSGVITGTFPPTFDVDFLPNCFLVRRSVFRCGIGFDPEVFPHNWSEPDFCFRVRAAGLRVVVVPAASESHDIGYTGMLTRSHNASVIYDQARSRIAFRKRHINGWRAWLSFGSLVFPLSSIVFLRAILRSDETVPSLKAYVAGTVDGLRQEVSPLPKEWTPELGVREWCYRPDSRLPGASSSSGAQSPTERT